MPHLHRLSPFLTTLFITTLALLSVARPTPSVARPAAQTTYAINGTVRADSSGLAGAVVQIYRASAFITSTVTSNSGSYTVRVPSGTYTITALLPSYVVSTPLTVTVNTSTLNNVNLTLLRQYFWVRGNTRLDGVGLPGVRVTAQITSTVLTQTVTALDGAYAFRLPYGVYTITASLPGFTFTNPVTASVTESDVNGQVFAATRLLYTVSGVITSGGTVLPGVQVSCDDTNAITNASGGYTLNGIWYGACVLAPTLSGYTFEPPFVPLSVTNNIEGQNFVATPIPMFSISGRILDAQSGEAVAGVQVTDGARTTLTDPGGFYQLLDVPPGTYSVSAAKSGYQLSAARTVVIGNIAVDGVNFSATRNVSVYDVSGVVRPFSVGLPSQCVGGVQIAYGIGSAVTPEDGAFTLLGLPPGTYAVTPVKSGCAFSPTTQLITVTNTGLSGVLFTEQQQPPSLYSISGRVTTAEGAGLGNATITYGAGAVTADAQGFFTIPGLLPNNYVLTPVLAGYHFDPATAQVIISDSNVVIVNLRGIPNSYQQLLPQLPREWPQLFCVTPDQDCGVEPDNAVRAGAQMLPTLNVTYHAQIGGTADVRDVYGFTLLAGTSYRMSVTHRAIGDLNIYLYDETSSTPLLSSAQRGTMNETLVFQPSVTGRYFLQVVAASVRTKNAYQFGVAY